MLPGKLRGRGEELFGRRASWPNAGVSFPQSTLGLVPNLGYIHWWFGKVDGFCILGSLRSVCSVSLTRPGSTDTLRGS